MVRDRMQEMRVISMGKQSSVDMEDGFGDSTEESKLLPNQWEDLNNFLAQVNLARAELDKLEEQLTEMRKLHTELLIAPGADTEMTRRLNSLVDGFNNRAHTVRKDIKTMEEALKELEMKADKTEAQSANIRIQRNQVMGLVKALHNVIHLFQSEQVDYKEKTKKKITDSLRVRGIQLAEDDIDDVIENGDLTEKTKGLMLASRERAELFQDVKSRHDELIKLEASILQLAEMFKDLQGLIASQGEMMDHIETNVNSAREYALKAKDNVTEARKLQASTRKKKIIICIFIMILLVILLIFLQGLVCHFTPIC